MKKKEKYKENNGLFHNATDYAVYHMKKTEIVVGGLVAALGGAFVFYIFFGIPVLCAVALPFCFLAGVVIYKKILLGKRNTRLILQFRDMLESVSSSLGSGRNVKDAFAGAYGDMVSQYGEDALISRELLIIRKGIANNVSLEALLDDFAVRSHNENIRNFSDVFSVANRRGGNIRQIIFETKNVINDKIMVEQDIQTIISGKKNELNIMMVLPLIIVTQTKSMQGGTSQDWLFDLLIKLIALFMFAAAYAIGHKMMDIRV